MMCATDYNGVCEGDSGEPLVVENTVIFMCWGTGCGKANKLGIDTNVLGHLNWVVGLNTKTILSLWCEYEIVQCFRVFRSSTADSKT